MALGLGHDLTSIMCKMWPYHFHQNIISCANRQEEKWTVNLGAVHGGMLLHSLTLPWHLWTSLVCKSESMQTLKRFSLGYLSNSCSKKKVNSRMFQPQRSSSATKLADEDLRGRNILLLTSFCYVNCSDTPERAYCRSMSVYHITEEFLGNEIPTHLAQSM